MLGIKKQRAAQPKKARGGKCLSGVQKIARREKIRENRGVTLLTLQETRKAQGERGSLGEKVRGGLKNKREKARNLYYNGKEIVSWNHRPRNTKESRWENKWENAPGKKKMTGGEKMVKKKGKKVSIIGDALTHNRPKQTHKPDKEDKIVRKQGTAGRAKARPTEVTTHQFIKTHTRPRSSH